MNAEGDARNRRLTLILLAVQILVIEFDDLQRSGVLTDEKSGFGFSLPSTGRIIIDLRHVLFERQSGGNGVGGGQRVDVVLIDAIGRSVSFAIKNIAILIVNDEFSAIRRLAHAGRNDPGDVFVFGGFDGHGRARLSRKLNGCIGRGNGDISHGQQDRSQPQGQKQLAKGA